MVRRALLATILVAGAFPALAAPPAPVIPPDTLPATVEGYDVATYYQIYRYWVEARKSDAIQNIMARVPEGENDRAYNKPLISFKKLSDLGHFLSGEVRTYCKPENSYRPDRSTCRYQLRRVYINMPTGVYGGEDNPVAKWMRESFDPALLVARLKDLKITPEADPWRQNRDALFAGWSSPIPLLERHATVVLLDSRQCPAMATALGALEAKQFDLTIDLFGVGKDAAPKVFAAHAIRREDTVNFVTPDGVVTVTGEQGALHSLIGPVFEAADACESARRGDSDPARPAG